MEQPVVIKSNKYGLTVILDPEPDFETIRNLVAEKFEESKKKNKILTDKIDIVREFGKVLSELEE